MIWVRRTVALYIVSWVVALVMAGMFQMVAGYEFTDDGSVWQPFPWEWTFAAAGVITLLVGSLYITVYRAED